MSENTDIRLPNGQDDKPHEEGFRPKIVNRLIRQINGERIGLI